VPHEVSVPEHSEATTATIELAPIESTGLDPKTKHIKATKATTKLAPPESHGLDSESHSSEATTATIELAPIGSAGLDPKTKHIKATKATTKLAPPESHGLAIKSKSKPITLESSRSLRVPGSGLSPNRHRKPRRFTICPNVPFNGIIHKVVKRVKNIDVGRKDIKLFVLFEESRMHHWVEHFNIWEFDRGNVETWSYLERLRKKDLKQYGSLCHNKASTAFVTAIYNSVREDEDDQSTMDVELRAQPA